MSEVRSLPIDELPSCNFDDRSTFWTHGWVTKKKFRGAMLSRRRYFDTEIEPEDIFKGKVVHGWILTTGDGNGWCDDGGGVTYLLTEEPTVVDGEWAGRERYDDDGEEIEGLSPVLDGPHKATWMANA